MNKTETKTNIWPCYAQLPATSDSFVRILHASPDAPPVDIYANGNLIASGLEFKQLTNYVPVKPGEYDIAVFPAGEEENPVIETTLEVPEQASFTAAVIGILPDISILPIMEVYKPMVDSQSSYIRIAHLSPDTPALDITLPNGDKLFSSIEYGEYSEYIAVEPGIYTLQLNPAGESRSILTVPGVRLSPGIIYTIYAVGLFDGTPPPDVLLATDGSR